MHIALGSRRPGRSVVNQSSANTARKTTIAVYSRGEKKKENTGGGKRRKCCRFSWIMQQMQHVESCMQQQHAKLCCIIHEQQQHLLICCLFPSRHFTHTSPGAMRGAGRGASPPDSHPPLTCSRPWLPRCLPLLPSTDL